MLTAFCQHCRTAIIPEANLSRSDRMFEIIQLLRRSRAPMPAHAIAAVLEVDKRTVYRDIAALQAMRVPVEGEAGVGYVMRAGFHLPPLMFTAEEVEAIAVGLILLARTRDGGLQQAASRVRLKLAEVLPPHITPIEGVPLRASTWSDVAPPEVDCGLIREAIRHERKLRFTYQDAASCRTTREVRPLTLTYWLDGIVLGAWCELRGSHRHFRLDRMTDCVATGEVFTGEGRHLRSALLSPASV